MGRIGITYQEVTKAISELQGKRKNPTVDNIRGILGTGSKSTIARFLREWKEKNNILPTDDTGMPIELLSLVKNLWLTLKEKTEKELHDARKAITAESIQLRQALQTEQQLINTLKKQNHLLEESNTDLMQQLNTAQSIIQQSKMDHQCLEERLGAMTRQNTKHEEEQQRLHDLLNHVQKNLEHYQTTSQQLRHEQSTLIEKQRHEYEQRISTLQNQLNTAQKQASTTEQSITTLSASLEQSEKSLQEILISNQENKSVRDQLTAKYNLLSDQHRELQQAHEEQTRRATTFEEKYITERNIVIKTQEELKHAQDKIKALRHDYQFIAEEKAGLQGQVELLRTGGRKLLRTG